MAAPRTLTITVSPQHEAAWHGARRRFDALRSMTGRVATITGTASALTVLVSPDTAAVTALATAAATAAGAGILRLQMPHAGHQKATATVLYAAPGTSLTVLLVAESLTAGASWGGTLAMQVLATAVWTAGTWLMRPGRVARRMACPPPPPATAAAPIEAPANTAPRHPAAAWWADNAAITGGPAERTVLESIEATGSRAMTAVIRATERGAPVPDIGIRKLSALMDIPEDQISITPVPGRGAGVRRLTIGKADTAATDPKAVWAERIAPVAVPGSIITDIRVGPPAITSPPLKDPT